MSGRPSFGRNKALLAAAVGAGAIIGAAGLYLYHSLEQKKKLKLPQEKISRDSRHLNSSKASLNTVSRRSKKNSVCSSRSGYETEDEMFSALNTDDDEDVFYDLNSEDEETLMRTLEEDEENKKKETILFEEVDLLMKGDDEDRINAFNLLKKYEFELSENPDFLWRYAKAHQIQAVVCEAVKDMANKKKYVFEGLEYASKALAMDDTNPDVHKWFAILTGMQGDFVSLKQKIQNGYLFQKHVLIAIECKPEDYSLHHLLGRFKYEVANVSWVEKKLASSILAEVPDLTYSDAITDLLTAEELNTTPWKENRLLLARCYIGDGKYDKAIQWLDSAKEITPRTKEDAACDQEINILIEKYKRYRK